MAFRIAAFPPGLLDLLEASREGRALSEASEVLLVTIDATDLYGLNQQTALGSNANLAVGPLVFFTVPTGQAWRLLGGSVFAQTGAGSTATDVAPFLQFASQLGALVYIGGNKDLAATQADIVPFEISTPLMLPAGTQIGVYCSAITGTPAANCAIIVQQLKA